jgi:hypothetical protein
MAGMDSDDTKPNPTGLSPIAKALIVIGAIAGTAYGM